LELDVIGLAKAPVVRGIGLEDGMLAELGAIAHREPRRELGFRGRDPLIEASVVRRVGDAPHDQDPGGSPDAGGLPGV
jgi:hypothetical protein